METEKRKKDLLEAYKDAKEDYNEAWNLMDGARCRLDNEEDEDKVAELEEIYKHNYDFTTGLEDRMRDITYKYKELTGRDIKEDLENERR